MGCPKSKPKPLSSAKSTDKLPDNPFLDVMRYKSDLPRVIPPSPPPRPPPLKNRSIPSSPQNQSRVQLYTPIYVALRTHSETQDDHLSFDEGDEMELIEELDVNRLRVKHLRSDLSGIVLKEFVQLDINTPLRLAVDDRGVINRCIMQYNVLGAYLIRRSKHNTRDFVLSIYQINEERNTSQWHYLIRIESLNKYFYFHDEHKLQNVYFSSFHQLVADERVRTVIPLTDVLPYTIEFDEELWNIPLNELSIEEKVGEGEFGEVFRGQWRKD